MNRYALYVRVAGFTHASAADRIGGALRIAMGMIAFGQILEVIFEAQDGRPSDIPGGIAVAVASAYLAVGRPISIRGSARWHMLWAATILMLGSLIIAVGA